MNPSDATPRDLQGLLDAAHLHFRASRWEEARRLLREAVEIAPEHGEALEGLAYLALREGDAAHAADYFDRAIEHLPPSPQRQHDAGMTNQAAGRHERALACFERALAMAPDALPTLKTAALCASELGRFDEAARALERVRELEPRAWQSHYNLGRALGLAGRYEEEIACYRRAIELQPTGAAAYVNLGVALRDLHRFDEALRVFKKAVQLESDHAGARTNRAQTNLLLGQFEHGWREYEWRWRDGGQQHPFGPNAWHGEASLAGKTLLVFNEQGFGDTLQFVRYVDKLAATTGARVILRVQDALRPLLAGYPGTSAVIGESDTVPPFDRHCPLMSLPFALAAHREPIPAPTPYLHADAARRTAWRERLGQARAGLRVGLAWSGSTTHLNDRNRSMPLASWRPIVDACGAGATIVSLVKEVREPDRDTLRTLPVLDVSDGLGTFADTAALVAELDLVICVDTAVAHLAGALGTPVWILLPYTPDWRWQLDRADSPWYSCARLFRQPARGDWAPVIEAVRDAVQHEAGRRG
ncbi:tetratricopeptide repeat-containing glycosyltransferase family protein [Trinickia caryophylli]|uniref:Tetratricopeptide (TPR) repeat n=1 Tax=Trinickia caryophylli TaxID=28094 RepID=A0A1X7EMG9_TRICW|nr:tetratricopeptide repeat-containing glycosyltransferase family protein [Trinickia caryophylli]PMS10282.1 tetratricopeptide repeat protein [Trinickia caryophylli]TRX18753.1 tetratricopeptide repeat protein [Trinickia caryophylli]WQE10452.1 tetratricopeptide repeat-containing glycosyltransferase family protein [Trinickia caryophylli]SMF36597.1 Tetratricopeptide (TPR) repeat [Trinickia caryophylli]GLU32800.1 hypothetical protein Busp01_26420 [Trinickia caryophylli]